MQRILAGIAGFRELGADIRARLADSAAKDAKRAEEEAARDKAIAARLIDPDTLARHGEAGARQGAREALASTVTEMRRQLAADADARELLSRQIANDHADRRAHEVRTRQHDRLWYGALAGFALLIPVALGYGYHLGDDDRVAASTDCAAMSGAADEKPGRTMDVARIEKERGSDTIVQPRELVEVRYARGVSLSLGHASSAIERRAQRALPAGEQARPVTVRGQFNEMVREARQLGVYIERGRDWLRSVGERVKALGPALSGLGVPGLVQGAARTMRAELDKGGGAGMKPAIGKSAPDRQRELPAFDRGRDDRDRGHGR